MSEVLSAKVTSNEEGGISRRRVAKGVAWSVPVIVTAIAAPAAAASPGPTPPPVVTPPSASIATGVQTVTSSVSGAHNRPGVTVPAVVSLSDLGGVAGNVEVQLTITPALQAIGAIAVSTVHVGSTSLTVGKSGNTFTFSYTLPAGATALIFNLSGLVYSGKKQDSGTFNVTSLITFQQGTATKQLTPGGPSIVLPKL